MIKLIDPHSDPATPGKLDSDSLVAQLYDELRKLARIRIAQLRPGRTLEPTELVHELYQRLAKQPRKTWENPTQFYRTAAKAMRNILIDYDRARNAQRRGRDYQRINDINITIADDKPPMPLSEWFILHQALEQMFEQYPQHAEVVLFRYFAGHSVEEIAELQDVHPSTVSRRWRFARAWLGAKLEIAPDKTAKPGQGVEPIQAEVGAKREAAPDQTVPNIGPPRSMSSNLTVTYSQHKTSPQLQKRAQQDDNVATYVEINEPV